MTSNVMSTHAQDPLSIEIRVERVSALFDALDPFPLPSRDLAPAAEAFIVGWRANCRLTRRLISLCTHRKHPQTQIWRVSCRTPSNATLPVAPSG